MNSTFFTFNRWEIDPPRPFRFFRNILNRILPSKKAKGNKKNILLFVHSPMMLEFVHAIYELIPKDGKFGFYCTGKYSPNESQYLIEYCNENDIKYIDPLSSSVCSWDLVICAENIHEYWFRKNTPIVLHFHGIDSGKLVPNTNEIYRYAKASQFTKTHSGKQLYKRIWEASHYNKKVAEIRYPEISSSLKVVGDLRADQMLSMWKERKQIREQLGIKPDEKVILFGCTWGKESMMESMRHELINEARKLKNKYRFIFSTHPQHWPPHQNNATSIGLSLLKHEKEGFIIRRQPSSCLPYLIAADAAIVDFSSTIVYQVLLKTPMACTPFPEHVIHEQSTRRSIYNACPHFSNPKDLEETIEHLLEINISEYKHLSHQILSYPGEAKKRIKKDLEINLLK